MVRLQADTNKLKNDYDLKCAGQVELTTLAVSTLNNTSLRKSGIATLTEKVLGVPYKKNKRATMSNWEIRDLTYAQIQYAAADAWLSYSILMTLLNYKEISEAAAAAAPPTLKSEKISPCSMVHHLPTRCLGELFYAELFALFFINSVYTCNVCGVAATGTTLNRYRRLA